MPGKDPDFLAHVWHVVTAPIWQGAIMAATISMLRVLYEGKEANKRRVPLEALMCGGMSPPASSVIEWMEWPPSLSVGAGGAIGFVGVTVIREMILKFLGRISGAKRLLNRENRLSAAFGTKNITC